MKDKKFKAVNREQNYAKSDAPDMQLGRHIRQSDVSKSTSRKMRAYQARQPTNENAETPHTAYTESSTVAAEQSSVENTTDIADTDTTEPTNQADIVFHENGAYSQPSAQHKNRIYQRHTEFAQQSGDYDFTKENQVVEYNFTETSNGNDTENAA